MRQNFFGVSASVLLFLLLFIVLKWPLLVATVLSVGTYFGVYYLAKPKQKIGDVELEALANGEELKALYDASIMHLHTMASTARAIENPAIREKALALVATGNDITAYLKAHPKAISPSRHFLEYYLKTGEKIITNYLSLKRGNVSSEKFLEIEAKTDESLALLNGVYAKQRDGYYEDQISDLEIETELLEKTLKLGGDPE
ncbi:5-bromo-4-chloroindolyl phosphate hydrolysis family protein [Aedoeadaptatus coli]|uniref:5-bromo-4-chloroindolyl phosphate hydrolysis family protein n=1 Tax=Aedoeadaptatus coli TaxID=2058292 RepID=UPI000D54FD0A|nr:5-bromo-4-chloroindolyl phosphate hydrolysis family protein [Peptoniphilus coli]